MSLLVGVLILAAAVFLGGVGALFRSRSARLMPAVRAFAVLAAVSIALLHLLPEAFGEIGWLALLAAAIGYFTPAALERVAHARHPDDAPPSRTAPTWSDPSARAPTVALALGYAAVLAHQLGEGAAVASLARVGALSPALVAAIAAHTVPLAMVVAIRVLEVRSGPGGNRTMALALTGVALATVAGALAGTVLGVGKMEAVEPWLIATVAGILLHALSHEALTSAAATLGGRAAEAGAGLLGLALGVAGVELDGWIQRVPQELRALGVVLLAGLIIARSFVPVRAGERSRSHAHRH